MTICGGAKFHDLTRTISQNIPVYPDDPRPRFRAHYSMKNDNVNVTKILLGSHTGTHVDAQWHFLPDGNTVDREPLDKFIGEAVIVDMSRKSAGSRGINAMDIDDHAQAVRGGDIMLVYTGAGDRRDGKMAKSFTYFEPSAAEWIVNHGIKCVGTDTLSVEKHGRKGAPVHKMLLANDIGIIENLGSNLGQFVGKKMFLVCLPLPLEGIDGSPARAVLFEMIK